MSEYLVCDTEIKDQDCLVDTLVEMGVERDHIEVHEEAVPLEGYHGDLRKQRAHVVIRRRHVGNASNDVGFELKDGSYKAWVSEYDKGHGIGKKIMSKELLRQYAKVKALNEIRGRRGFKVKSCEEKDGKIKIKVLVS